MLGRWIPGFQAGRFRGHPNAESSDFNQGGTEDT